MIIGTLACAAASAGTISPRYAVSAVSPSGAMPKGAAYSRSNKEVAVLRREMSTITRGTKR